MNPQWTGSMSGYCTQDCEGHNLKFKVECQNYPQCTGSMFIQPIYLKMFNFLFSVDGAVCGYPLFTILKACFKSAMHAGYFDLVTESSTLNQYIFVQ